MRFIYFKAPFGAFRPFKSVELSPTAEFLTHSAAYGFLLGLAGVERQQKEDFIGARVAVGCTHLPKLGRTFQQLIQGKRSLEDTGGDFKLRPFWREVLCDLEGYIGLDHPVLEALVEQGINAPTTLDYWGLPFMGDNNFFVEKLDVFDKPPQPCRWFCLFEDNQSAQGAHLYYLSVWTDYVESTRSKSLLFFLKSESEIPPDLAWVTIKGK